MIETPAFAPTSPEHFGHAAVRARNLREMILTMDALRAAPIVTLARVIVQMGLLDQRALSDLLDEDPDLLRSQSAELVRRVLLTSEELHHALARTAGIVEVDAARFLISSEAFALLPLRVQRAQDLLGLGEVDGPSVRSLVVPHQ